MCIEFPVRLTADPILSQSFFGRLNFTDEEIQCEIIAGWSRSSQASSQAGKKLHHEIELALNGEHLENESEELRQFYAFMSEFVVPRHWEAYRTEWAIFHEETIFQPLY